MNKPQLMSEECSVHLSATHLIKTWSLIYSDGTVDMVTVKVKL